VAQITLFYRNLITLFQEGNLIQLARVLFVVFVPKGKFRGRCDIFGRSDNVGKIGIDNDEEFVEFKNDQFLKLKFKAWKCEIKM